ncbi:vacuolar membrane-associated protein iml1 [Ascosphaera acerosa]|nr:vacuolar membrane-associated protein iml1 [Ascosphaera acerosa]
MASRDAGRSSRLRRMSAAASPASEQPATDQGSMSSARGSGQHAHDCASSITQRVCTLWVHDESFSREDVLLNLNSLPDLAINVGDLVEVRSVASVPPTTRARDLHVSHASNASIDRSEESSRNDRSSHRDKKFRTGGLIFRAQAMPPDLQARQPDLQVSIATHVATRFGFKNRMSVLVALREKWECAASHVELAFRDQFLLRADQWRLTMSELADKTVYQGQKILYMGTIRATVQSIWRNGKKVQSAFFSHTTIPIFRSESARYVVFIQMSREMWDFDSENTGDILFSRVINSLLPELFKRWAAADAHHLVTVILFTRVEHHSNTSNHAVASGIESTQAVQPDGGSSVQDYYRVVVNDMPSGNWTLILDQLKCEFRVFLRDVSMPQRNYPDTLFTAEDIDPRPADDPARITGRPTTSVKGNILEAINLASSYLEHEHTGRDITRSGTSVVLITPGSGVFEVTYETLALTSEVLTSRAIGLDLICLSPQPLHAVPLFKYKPPTKATKQSSRWPLSLRPQDSLDSSSHDFRSSGTTSSHADALASALYDQPDTQTRDWVYGFPHWIDISFWDPRVYHQTGLAVNRIMRTCISETVTKHSQMFRPRVRMYEIQMMGVMESEQSSISLPYLSTQSLGNLALCSTDPYREECVRFQDQREASSFHTAADESLYIPKPLLTKSYMEAYDWQCFHTGLRCRDAYQERYAMRDSPVKRTMQETHRTARATGHIGWQPRGTKQSHGPRSLTAESSAVNRPAHPASSDSKIARKINFALRGLGPTPPRAVASTEIVIENASATTRTTHAHSHDKAGPVTGGPLPSSSSVRSSVTDVPVNQPTSTRPLSLSSAAVRQQQAATPSKPILIRPALARGNRAESNEHMSVGLGRGTLTYNDSADRSRPYLPTTRTGKASQAQHVTEDSEKDPIRALAPWVVSVTPCKRKGPIRPSWFGRWQHVYPRMPHATAVKWKSLKSPAVLPLTTEEFPSEAELNSDYYQTPYRVNQNEDESHVEGRSSRQALLTDMISLRLSQGFQIVVGRAVQEASGYAPIETVRIFDTEHLSRDGMTLFMSMGNVIHRIVCVLGGDEIEVTRYTRKSSGLFPSISDDWPPYAPAVKTILSTQYCKIPVSLRMPREQYNWNYVDAYLAGHRDHLRDPEKQLQFWRARFVLIPAQVPTHGRRALTSLAHDTEEEIHLLGINQLTNLWQKNRYTPPEEKHILSRHRKQVQNPLNIIFQTSNPSEVVAAELGRLLIAGQELDSEPAQLLRESELYERDNVNLAALAQTLQGAGGVQMLDRRWHFRLHRNCFVGTELTTWILQNFRDVDTREEAVQFGNELMEHGVFHHVRHEHNFRDGNYFYQFSDDYILARSEVSGGRPLSKPSEKSSAPPTPTSECRPTSGNPMRAGPSSDAPAGNATCQRQLKARASVYLSKSLKYDLDPRKRSDRPEIATLHYDRLHNPDNCFHLELHWTNITPKLVEDAVASWTATAEKYGLRLVEVPVAETVALADTQVFRRPYPIRLSVNPADFLAETCGEKLQALETVGDPLLFHKAIMKRFDFVLDFESHRAFPADVDVRYSWGKPDYEHHQYIHRSGCVVVQITDDGVILLAANHLYSSRTASRDVPRPERGFGRPRASTMDLHTPTQSPVPTATGIHEVSSQPPGLSVDTHNVFRAAEYLRDELRRFCQNKMLLRQFFASELTSAAHAQHSQVGPYSMNVSHSNAGFQPKLNVTTALGSMTDSAIPALELSESGYQPEQVSATSAIFGQHQSPSASGT